MGIDARAFRSRTVAPIRGSMELAGKVIAAEYEVDGRVRELRLGRQARIDRFRHGSRRKTRSTPRPRHAGGDEALVHDQRIGLQTAPRKLWWPTRPVS